MFGSIGTFMGCLLASKKYIQSNDDLNNYLTAGRYTCSDYGVANTVANMPGGPQVGWLIVMNGNSGFVWQIVPGKTAWANFLQLFISINGNVFVRTISTGADKYPKYNDWYKFTKELVAT